MDYNIYTGFHAEDNTIKEKQEFFDIWLKNTLKYTSPKKIIIISTGFIPKFNSDKVSVINLEYNLGHIGQQLDGIKNHYYCGWSGHILLSAIHAYNSNVDFFYKEQDCLAFGDWINRIYGYGCDFSFGYCNNAPYNTEQSLFFIRNAFLLTFMKEYMSIQSNDIRTLPEYKFKIIEDKHRNLTQRLDFGYGRDNIISFNLPFYAQHIDKLTLKEIKDI